MNRCLSLVPVKLVKYKNVAVLCILVIFVKSFVSYTMYTESGKELSCLCDRDGESVGVRLEETQSRGSHHHHNRSAVFQNRFHLKIVSDDPLTRHEWPWLGQNTINRCKMKNWHTQGTLAKTSVIVTFMDKENIATLLRTIHSIVQKTPKQLLEEVILVEDNCVKEEFHETLDIYLEAVFGGKVRVLRYSQTLGLIKARLAGIRAARGEVVVCMDSHVEVQQHWLEPLLYEIKINRKTLATSYLDWIEKTDDVWVYRHGASSWKTYFDMALIFGFQENSPTLSGARRRDPTTAVECPVTVGTIWSMERKFFTEIGEFDEGMELWGGENLDLPLRVWLFGGRVINVPCSHAAHLEVKGYRDYRLKWLGSTHKNYKRFMQVWFGEYAPYFYPYFPGMKERDPGDLSARYALKQRAQHNITWFFNNVFPELGIPQIHGLAWGEIVNGGTEKCLTDTPQTVQTGDCGGAALNYYFYWSKDLQELRFPMHAFNIRQTETAYGLQKEEYMSLYRMNISTRWLHWKNGPLMIEDKDICLQAIQGNVEKVELATCDFSNPHQKWTFSQYTKDYDDIIDGSSQKYTSLVTTLQKYKKYFSDNHANS